MFMKNREISISKGERFPYLWVSAKVCAFIPNRLLSFVTCEFEKKILIFFFPFYSYSYILI